MKKILLSIGIGALLLASCSSNEKKIDEDSQRIAELSTEYQEATDFNDSLMLLMGDIYTGLDSINQQEGLLYNMGTGDNADRRAEIRQNLANIKARLNANRALLDKMEGQLKNSNSQNAVLTKTIAQLKAHIEQQDSKIAQLENDLSAAKGQIEDLNTQVAEGQEQVKAETEAKEKAQQETVAAENAANTVYYAIGTNKELKKNGLLEKKFLGATKVLQGNFNQAYFTKADRRNLNSIPTQSKKVKVWSNMPKGSYEIVDGSNGFKTVKITDPSKFWSLTPYLIIQVD
jgi:lipoprotein